MRLLDIYARYEQRFQSELLSIKQKIKRFYSTYLIDTSIMAKIKYFPNSGTTKDVGGIISTTSRKNT